MSEPASRPAAPHGLHVVVDGSGLARPWAGVGTYTDQILHAMAVARPHNRFTVYVPAGVTIGHRAIATRPLPAARFVGRHLQFPSRVNRLKADVYFGPAGQLPLGSVDLPSVLTVHDLAIYIEPRWFPGGQALSTRFIVPRSLERAAALIAVSANTAEDLSDRFGIDPRRIEVVHSGVNAAFRPLEREQAQEVRQRYQLPERFILFVGTIEPRKNLLTLLEAWVQMSDRPPLVIAGGWGWRFEEVETRLQRLGDRVRLLGGVPPADLPALYSLATCLAHPAWYEGFGLTPLEAMACGTPVVCSDTSSLPEVVGDAALLVDPGDVDAWRVGLERVLSDLDFAADLRRKGILRAAEFSWDSSAEKTWKVIERAAGA